MLRIENGKFLIGREEYYAISAELHYFRVNKKHWSVCFERIRKAGFRIISTCIPWNLHEISLGDFDFFGETDPRRDLVVFLELAREFGFKVILRPGPYIGAEWDNGGYPDFLFTNPEILAKDSQGESVEQASQIKVKSGLVPCYNHPRFQNQVKRYFSALSDVIKSYTYPKGPVIMIGLDNHPSFGKNTEPFKLDYNEYIVGTLYPQFLQEKYDQIKHLNSAYIEKNKRFTDIQPPKHLKITQPKQLPKYLDWIEFKEKYLANYIENLKEIFVSCEIPAIFSTVLFQEKLFSVPFNWTLTDREEKYVGAQVGIEKSYPDLISHLRYYATCSRFAWAYEFRVGNCSDDPSDSRKYFPVSLAETKLQLVSSLSSGIKGFNYYMFVERDHWYDSPLAEDGTLQGSYELIRKFNQAVEKIELEKFDSLAEIGLVNYRPYLWHTHLGIEKSLGYVLSLVSLTGKNLVSDLLTLNLDFGIADMWLMDNLSKFKLLFMPVAEYMDGDTQRNILELAKGGKSIVLFGLLPKYDERMKGCEILSKGLKLRTSQKEQVGEIKTSSGEFIAQAYGFIRRARGKSLVIAKLGDKPVGVKLKVGKGMVYFFSFDICARLNHSKLSFLETIIDDCLISRPIITNHPFTYVVPRKANKKVVLYVARWDKGEEEKVIIQVDCRRVGIKGVRIRLTDLLGEEVVKTTSSELKRGLAFKLAPLDSKMYLVETR
jgi:beta-galactosidase